MSRRRDAKLLGDFEIAASGATGSVASAADQGLKDVVARLAMKFVEWHKRSDSSVFGTESQLVDTACTWLYGYSGSRSCCCQCRERLARISKKNELPLRIRGRLSGNGLVAMTKIGHTSKKCLKLTCESLNSTQSGSRTRLVDHDGLLYVITLKESHGPEITARLLSSPASPE
jgi:hypothetical protein